MPNTKINATTNIYLGDEDFRYPISLGTAISNGSELNRNVSIYGVNPYYVTLGFVIETPDGRKYLVTSANGMVRYPREFMTIEADQVTLLGDRITYPGTFSSVINGDPRRVIPNSIATLELYDAMTPFVYKPEVNKNIALLQITSQSVIPRVRMDGYINEIGYVRETCDRNMLTTPYEYMKLIGKKVKKRGAASGLTVGAVVYTNAQVVVEFSVYNSLLPFQLDVNNAIIVEAFCAPFALPGDAGSLVVKNKSNCPKPVGTVLAGSLCYTVVLPINEVIDRINSMLNMPSGYSVTIPGVCCKPVCKQIRRPICKPDCNTKVRNFNDANYRLNNNYSHNHTSNNCHRSSHSSNHNDEHYHRHNYNPHNKYQSTGVLECKANDLDAECCPDGDNSICPSNINKDKRVKCRTIYKKRCSPFTKLGCLDKSCSTPCDYSESEYCQSDSSDSPNNLINDGYSELILKDEYVNIDIHLKNYVRSEVFTIPGYVGFGFRQYDIDVFIEVPLDPSRYVRFIKYNFKTYTINLLVTGRFIVL